MKHLIICVQMLMHRISIIVIISATTISSLHFAVLSQAGSPECQNVKQNIKKII